MKEKIKNEPKWITLLKKLEGEIEEPAELSNPAGGTHEEEH